MEHPSEQIETLLSQGQIADRIAEMGSEIARAYEGSEQPLVVVCVLKGAALFFADLVRAIDLPLEFGFKGISSYGDSQTSSGAVHQTVPLSMDVSGRDVLIVEDLVDTGLSAQYLMNSIQSMGPRSVKFCALLEKPEKNKAGFLPDFLGFKIPDAFVIGYGLDHAGIYRNLPFVGRII